MKPRENSIMLYPDGGDDFLNALAISALYFDKIHYLGIYFSDQKPHGFDVKDEKEGMVVEDYPFCYRVTSELLERGKKQFEFINRFSEEGVISSIGSDSDMLLMIIKEIKEIFKDSEEPDVPIKEFPDLLTALVASLKLVGSTHGDGLLLLAFAGILSDGDTAHKRNVQEVLKLPLESESVNEIRLVAHLITLMESALYSYHASACPVSWSNESFVAFNRILDLGILNERSIEYDKFRHNMLAFSALNRSLPYLCNLDADQILALREKLKPLAAQFHEYIYSVAMQSTETDDANDYRKWAENKISKEVDPLLRELEASVDNFYKRLVRKLATELKANICKASVPIVGSAIAGIRLDLAAMAALATVFGTTIIEESMATKEQIHSSPVSYLMKIRQATRTG